MKQPITPDLEQKILALHDTGHGYGTIGRMVGRHTNTIQRVVYRNRLTTDAKDDPEPLIGVDMYYGDVRVRWRDDEFKRLMDVLEARRKKARL